MDEIIVLIMKIILGLGLISLIFGPIVFRFVEQRQFNKGFCTECGEHMRHFATDSQGGEGWICEGCGRVIWVSWIDTSRQKWKI